MTLVEVAQLAGTALGTAAAVFAAKRAGQGRADTTSGLEAVKDELTAFRIHLSRELASLQLRLERAERRLGISAWSPPDGTPAAGSESRLPLP